jgi:hypothetical protein
MIDGFFVYFKDLFETIFDVVLNGGISLNNEFQNYIEVNKEFKKSGLCLFEGNFNICLRAGLRKPEC